MNTRKILLTFSVVVSLFVVAPMLGKPFMIALMGQAVGLHTMGMYEYWMAPIPISNPANHLRSVGDYPLFYGLFMIIFLLSTFVLYVLSRIFLSWVRK